MSDPIPGGTSSPLARRRLTLHHEADPPARFERTYQAEDDLQHHDDRGRRDQDGWSANTADDDAGHLLYGPYATDWPGTTMQVEFRILIDVVDSREEVVATIEVYDADQGEFLAQRDLRRADFLAPMTYQDFALEFEMEGRVGHRMETRVFWRDISYKRVERVVVRER